MIFKYIFTWWNKQTFELILKQLFTGKYIGKDNLEINIIRTLKTKGGLYIQTKLNHPR